MRFLTVILLLYAVPSLSSGETIESVLAKMDRAAASFKSMSSKIRRVSHTAVINEDNTDTGTMLLKRSNPHEMMMLIELTEPDQKSVAFQGQKLEMYYPKIKTVQEYDVGKNRGLLDQFLLLGFGSSGKELSAAYFIKALGSEEVAGQKTTRLELTPKSKEVISRLKKVELWIADANGYPAQQKFYLPAGDYTLVTYTDLKINPNLSNSALKLNLPRGVKREFPQK